MPIKSNLLGTLSTYFKVSLARLKYASGKLALRNADDSAYLPLEALNPTTAQEVVTKDFLESRIGTATAVNGAGLSNNTTNPTYQVDIGVGFAVADDGSVPIPVVSPITVDITASGANGLDTGAEVSATLYCVWLIYNPTTVTTAGLLSVSFTSPTMPSGYTKKRRLGFVINGTTGNFFNFTQSGGGNNRLYFYNEDHETTLRLISGGGDSIPTELNPGALHMPPTSYIGIFYIIPLTSGKSVHIRKKGQTSGFFVGAHTQNGALVSFMPTDSIQKIEYLVVSPGVASVAVLGCKETI